MIRIARGAEPAGLAELREAQLKTVGATRPARTPAHRAAYNSVKRDLALAQHRKCCYCERIETPAYNDVEHYRPFSTHWWLAWTWSNLLFACATRNRSGKNDEFPLDDGSVALVFGQQPPGDERPLMIDPGSEDPREHIAFERNDGGIWFPVGRTARGRETLRVLALDDDYRDHVQRRVADVMHCVQLIRRDAAIDAALARDTWARVTARLLDPQQELAALTEAILRHEFETFPDPPT